jgi:hypothetical protein
MEVAMLLFGTGLIVSIFGWIMIMAGVSAHFTEFAMVGSDHFAILAQNVVILGYVVMLMGLIVWGVERIVSHIDISGRL